MLSWSLFLSSFRQKNIHTLLKIYWTRFKINSCKKCSESSDPSKIMPLHQKEITLHLWKTYWKLWKFYIVQFHCMKKVKNVLCWKMRISFCNIEKYVQLCDFSKLTFLLVLLQNFTHYQTFFTIVKTAATTNKIWPNGEKTTYSKFF